LKTEDAKKNKILSKIKALDPFNESYDMLYDALQEVLADISKSRVEIEDDLYNTELSLSNATSAKCSAESIYKVMGSMIEMMDMMPDEDERIMMNVLLDNVQLYEVAQPNGMWVKSVRFKVPLNVDGELYDELFTNNCNSLPNETTDETVCLLSRKAQ
jgi:site-specific DNA recombinase